MRYANDIQRSQTELKFELKLFRWWRYYITEMTIYEDSNFARYNDLDRQ